MNSPENCRDTAKRRRRIREAARRSGSQEPNGIDYVEVDEGQTVITVYFLNKAPHGVRPENVRVEGGVRVRDIRVVAVTLCEVEDEARDDCMRVVVDKYGDFSTYTLRLVEASGGRPGARPLAGFDPRYAQIEFSFKANCPSDFDCAPADDCPKQAPPEPEIDYLARDYASFQRLIYDRLSLVMPDWKERHVPDIGVALVELFAYVGDYLSYFQDAVATEAYLDTARRRISVRRHARLVDYLMHEGCNARAWVAIETDGDVTVESTKDFYFVTGRGASYGAGGRVISEDDLRGVAPSAYEVFEPLTAGWRGEPFRLRKAHSRISFYTWGDRECCLPRGATSATLRDAWKDEAGPGEQHGQEQGKPGKQYEQGSQQQQQQGAQQQQQRAYEQGGVSDEGPEGPGQKQKPPGDEETSPPRERALSLSAGDVLIFEEVLGPVTGAEPDADRTHRHAVRLTRVEPRVDELYGRPVVEIEWAAEDALPFTLCLSAVGRAPECLYLEDVSVARGNVILVDHGRTTGPEYFDVPEAEGLPAGCFAAFDPREPVSRARRFRPTLKRGNVTHRAPFPAPTALRAAQVRLLGRLTVDVRARVEWIRTRVREAGRALSKEELAELVTIFGRATLVRAGVAAAGAKEKQKQPSPTPAEQAEGLGRLLARFDDHVSKKARRVRVLRERVLGGYTLARAEREELKALFGARFVGGLEPSSGITYGPASVALTQNPREALASVKVRRSRQQPAAGGGEGAEPAFLSNHYPRWWPAFDLLGAADGRRLFVAEIDDEGRAHLRFDEGEAGRAPEPGTALSVTYRVGNGARGNVGPEAVSHIVMRRKIDLGVTVSRVRNPLPAAGGVEPEPVEEARVFAPGAFRKELRRAVTPEDYGSLAERDSAGRVQRAAGSLRWGGSWQVMQTAVDARGASEADASLLAEVEGSLHRYRRIGHELLTRTARAVPLDIVVEVCVLPHYLRGHVRAALSDVFSNRDLPGGRRGFFHPDNLSFGEAVHLSRLVAAAQAVEGVESVRVTRLQRLYEGPRRELEEGLLPLGPLEVARVDNDPNFPEHGRLKLEVRGGR
jgi:hypothetical protein